MKDIARDLGVSVMTVSKVLRDHPDIGQETKERVIRRAKELNFTPNLMARALVTGRSHLIALIVPDLLHSFFVEIANSLSTALRKKGYSILISWTAEDAAVEATEIQHLLSLGMDAMIVATSTDKTSSFRMLEERGIPYVLIDRDIPELKASFIGVNDLLIGKMATKHLIDIGCKRIGHVSGPPMSPGARRLAGYRLALEEAGIPVRPELIVTPLETGPRGARHGFEATERLLLQRPRVDGIFCFNDPLAVGTIEAVRGAGLRVPEDVAIIGCGNLPIGSSLRLPLSTMDQNTEELGRKTAGLVLGLIGKNKGGRARRIILEPKLVIRGTSERKPAGRRKASK